MIAANRTKSPPVAEPSSGGGMNWLTSIGLSVSQLFTGNAQPAAAPKESEGNEDEADGDDVAAEFDNKPLSSNGEVPIDEENEESVPKELANVDVRTEATRIHQGNTIRKKILF